MKVRRSVELCAGAAGLLGLSRSGGFFARLVCTALALATVAAVTRSAAAEEVPRGDARDPQLENPSTYEFAFVSVGIEQALRLGGSMFLVGAGGGLGPPLFRIGQMKCAGSSDSCNDRETRDVGFDPSLEIAYASVFLRFAPIPELDLDVGPKIAIASTLYGVPDAPASTFTYGFYSDLRIGSPTVKIGPRFEFVRSAYADFYEMGWKVTPLMLRIVH
jgi:hypothetical protein